MTDKRNEGWETQEWEKITGKKRALEVVIKFLVLNGVQKALKGVFTEGWCALTSVFTGSLQLLHRAQTLGM